MEAKDTVMSRKLLWGYVDVDQMVSAQAEISFKLGIKEVVEYFDEQVDFEDDEVCPYYVMNKKVWEAQKKEWGI